MSDSKYDHVDFFGQPLAIGDYVTAGWKIATEPLLAIYKIDSFEYVRFQDQGKSDRVVLLNLIRVTDTKKKPKCNRWAKHVIKIDPALLTFKKLKFDHST